MTVCSARPRPDASVIKAFVSAKRLLAVTHMNPDGDAIGSLVGMAHIAASLGIDLRLYCETPVPTHLDWLTSPAPFVTSLAELGAWQPDRVLFLDCADETRAGEEMTTLITACRNGSCPFFQCETICIDHHIANPCFAHHNWVDPSMSATGLMAALVARELNMPLAGYLGEALYLAIVSDTGSFSYANTNALSLEIAAEIVANGLNLAEFTTKYENNWTLGRMHLWGELMREVSLLCDGKVVVSVVTDDHLARHNASRVDLEGYASWLRRLRGSRVVLLSRTSRCGSKISLRSMGDVDVQEIAAAFGGGGHKGAAGANMTESPAEAAAKVIEAVCKALCHEEKTPGCSPDCSLTLAELPQQPGSSA